MGDRRAYLSAALERIREFPGTVVEKKSPLYETKPLGPAQGDFLNAVVQIVTALSPQELLAYCQRAEQALGRERRVHWGSRTVDIDILLYGQQVIKERQLSIPHPEMSKRSFVLVPLLMVEEGIVIPGIGPAKDLPAAKAEAGEIRFFDADW